MPKPRIYSEENWRIYNKLYKKFQKHPTDLTLKTLLDFRETMRFFKLKLRDVPK